MLVVLAGPLVLVVLLELVVRDQMVIIYKTSRPRVAGVCWECCRWCLACKNWPPTSHSILGDSVAVTVAVRGLLTVTVTVRGTLLLLLLLYKNSSTVDVTVRGLYTTATAAVLELLQRPENALKVVLGGSSYGCCCYC